MIKLEIDKPLPALRTDIEIYSGPIEEDGSPMYVVHDPVVGTFSKIGWEEAQVLKRLRTGQTLYGLIKEVSSETTLSLSPDDVLTLCGDAQHHQLTMDSLIIPADELKTRAESKKENLFTWLARHYLYFRVPLIHPDDFLIKTIGKARILNSFFFKCMYAFFALLGLFFLSQRFETYLSTFSYFFNVKGFVVFSAVIVGLKTAHEFGHAYTAKHYGLRVPTMGMAFMVFFPVAYSDVTDAWRLRSRKKRLNIALAGVYVEFVIGMFALALWGVTPPGLINSLCFALSSTTLISTLLINLNPAMRYDGYYILSDVLGIDNLSQQTTLYTKWVLWRLLLGFNAPSPMPRVSMKKKVQMVLYAVYSWHYRLFLYLAIAVVVYHKFTKVLGVVLFSLEIILLIIRPVWRELMMLRLEKNRININRRLVITLTCLGLLAAWVIIPFPRNSIAPAVFLPVKTQTVYTHRGGEVREVLKKKGEPVVKGDVILKMASQTLDNEIKFLQVNIRHLEAMVNQLSQNPDRLGMVPEIKKQLASKNEELQGLIEQRKQMVIKASMDGILYELDDTLKAGIYVKENQAIGKVTFQRVTKIDAFFSEKDITHIHDGDTVTFYPSDLSIKIKGTIFRINPIREDYVDILDIGSVAASELPLIKDPLSGRLTFIESYYRVIISPTGIPDNTLRLGTSGYIRYKSNSRSLAWDFFQYCYSVIIRESGF